MTPFFLEDLFGENIDAGYKKLAKVAHPDAGGDPDNFVALTKMKSLAVRRQDADEFSPEEPDNIPGQFQGAMRYGWLNVDELSKAAKHNGGVDRLVVNHLDQWRPGWKVYSAGEYRPVVNVMGARDLLAEALAPVEITGHGRDVDDRRWHSVD